MRCSLRAAATPSLPASESMLRVAAVDLGASSVRIAVIDLDATPPSVDIVHRYPHGPVRDSAGHLRWDWPRLLDEVERGLALALDAGPLASIGIDTWGVDYGLLGASGALLSPPYSYRDDRTARWREVAARIGAEKLYRTTGIQLLQINTIFQLAAHDREELARARSLLMLPELVVHHLTGALHGERTSAGTTGIVDLATGDWSPDVLDAIGVDPAIVPRIERAPQPAGAWRGVPVHLVGGHDTASAVVALPAPKPNAARAAARGFISSGTWMIIGVERLHADVSGAAMRANFSNEPAALDGVRFLKNVTGMWMLEQLRAQWGSPPLDDLLRAAAALPAGGPTVDATDERFLAPSDMEAELRAAAHLPASAGRDAVARCVLDSLARGAANVIDELRAFVGDFSEVIVIGGGAQNTLLNRLIEEACGAPVRVGPVEATALGNALVQGIALDRFTGLDDARAAIVS
jgi:rhamnulokinase